MNLLEGLVQADFEDTLAAVEGRVDLLAFSPPYKDARTYGASVSWTFEDYQRLGDSVLRALRPDGGQCLMVLDGPVRDYRGDGYTERSVMPFRVLLDWRDRLGLVFPDHLAYGRAGQVGKFPQGFKSGWEPLLWFATPGRRTMNQEVIATPCLRPGRDGRSMTGRDRSGAVKRGKGFRSSDVALPSTLWRYRNTGGDAARNPGAIGGLIASDHPARFPYRLARDLVLCFSNPGDLVVDSFVGSGTTMIAALDHGRRFYGGDLLARQGDGRPWIDIAEEIAEDRYAQRTIFELPAEPAKVEQLELLRGR